MCLLENDVADAEQRRHDRDAESEPAREHCRADRTWGQRAEREPQDHATTVPLFIASRRCARSATTGLCVTTTIAVPSP